MSLEYNMLAYNPFEVVAITLEKVIQVMMIKIVNRIKRDVFLMFIILLKQKN